MKQVFPLSIQSGMSQSGSYILMLCEPVSGLQIPIFIGAHEAEGILLAKETVKTRRPMTHELMAHIMNDYGLTIKEVTIDNVMEGIFYATIHMTDGFNEKHFDSRTSDAVAIALSMHAPIYISSEVMDETGIKSSDMENRMETDEEQEETFTLEELEEQLQQLLEEEEYEKAAEIQAKIDEMKKSNL